MPNDDLDVAAQAKQHPDETIGRKLLEVAVHESRHLGRGVLDDDARLLSRQAELGDTLLRLDRQRPAREMIGGQRLSRLAGPLPWFSCAGLRHSLSERERARVDSSAKAISLL
jgi:hypothetical protein